MNSWNWDGTQYVITKPYYFTSAISAKVTTVTTTTHTAADEYAILVDDDTAGADVTVTLPAAATWPGRIYHVKKLGTTASVIVDGNGSETIDGSTTVTIGSRYDSIELICDGSNWHII